jgi:hypothetical protein
VNPAPVVTWPFRIRHHWIVLFKLPRKWGWLGLAVLFVVGLTGGWLGWLPLIVVVGAVLLFRYQEWRAEVITLDKLTIRYTQGVQETTTSRALLRIDRISGIVLSRTVPGKLLGYGSLHLEAPGSHPDIRHLERIDHPELTAQLVESLMFRTATDTDPDDVGADGQQTAPLPRVSSGDTGRLPGSPRR